VSKVQIVNPAPNALESLRALFKPLLKPIGTAALVCVLVIFMLLRFADVRDRSNSLADRQGVALRVDVADDELMLIGDERRLHQALLNLVRNAIDHSQSGGEVTLGALREVGEVVLTVRDEGDGIAPDDLPRVWERFFKTDRARQGGGTGLGLAIVRNIVQAHGGTVEASSEVGKGSEFVLRIPGSMVESQANLLSSSTSAVNQRERSGNRDWFP
jgi:signal transduction histidine kinase